MNTPIPAFIDTNVLLYLLSADSVKADRAEEILAGGGFVSVQVLNEFASVALRKLGLSYPEIHEVLQAVRGLCLVLPLDLAVHESGLQIAERYGFSIYDALIVAAALKVNCQFLYTEDLQNGQLLEEGLKIINPFR